MDLFALGTLLDFLGRGEVEKYIKNNKHTDVLEMMRNLMADFWRVLNGQTYATCINMQDV